MPKKLSTCPKAMIIAMPLVKPMTTLVGMKLTSLPRRRMPASRIITPAASDARNTPCKPYWATMPMRMALMAPVGPLIWKDAPPSSPMTSPPMMAVTSPAAASAPEDTPNARASGSATAATVMPLRMSLRSLPAL